MDAEHYVVCSRRRQAGLPPKPRTYHRRYPQLGDHTWLRRRYLDEAASLTDLAREIGCGITAVRKALKLDGSG